MKRIKDLTRDELVALTDDQIQRYIDIECAEDGVALLPPAPTEPDVAAPEPDIECWSIPSVIFRERADALKVIDLITGLSRVMQENLGGWRYHYNYMTPRTPTDDDRIDPKRERMWSPKRFDESRNAVDAANEAKEEYRKKKDAFDRALSMRAEVAKRVREKVDGAHAEVWEEDNVRREFNRYVEIADGDKTTALRFFKNAHKQYDDEWLLPVLHLVGTDEAAPAITD